MGWAGGRDMQPCTSSASIWKTKQFGAQEVPEPPRSEGAAPHPSLQGAGWSPGLPKCFVPSQLLTEGPLFSGRHVGLFGDSPELSVVRSPGCQCRFQAGPLGALTHPHGCLKFSAHLCCDGDQPCTSGRDSLRMLFCISGL